ncbi:hypothetical protein EVAR_88407_1 [Eumeta japonica]|uniref:RNA-binding region-containing protein 3 n=1 Tax=Eumeta variegata TaxID=151549 RepID=A0A4C1Y4P6_EUMVA|nr:hypothetical protein EVAR_88407_1 [Eumeta japonica]
MSNVLIIRHLPEALSFQEKEQLLKHFGAQKVWQTSTQRNYVFAAFRTIEQAKNSLHRLHQLEIANKRLVVEYSTEKELVSSKKSESQNVSFITTQIKEFLRSLNAWNPSVDFYQPPSPYIKYEYPPPTPESLINIIYALLSHKPLYIQLLHLMNKMCLESPFSVNDTAVAFFKNLFKEYLSPEITGTSHPDSEIESELSSAEENTEKCQNAPKLLKRNHLLPKTRKRIAAVLATATLPAVKKKAMHQEIFEEISFQEHKKISLVVSQDVLAKKHEVQPEEIGKIGILQKEETKEDLCVNKIIQPEKPTITKKELLQNKISFSDMKKLPVFKNYHPGEPSMRLYIKNLAKSVHEEDVIRIYKRYVEELDQSQQNAFDVRIMQEGKMKGQGFVTFPSVGIAQMALNETNGFILKDKPIVVQFARVANKKTI